jgi:Zn-finger protein
MICFLPFFMTANAQENSKKKQRKIEKLKEKKDQETLKSYQKAIKVHRKDQTKATRKRMKQTLKASNEVSPGHKTFFLKRWFSKK